MSKFNITIILLLLIIPSFFFIAPTNAFAGNKDRVGQAGASELLINPWGRSSGFHGMNTSIVTGLEAMRVNPAGLAFTKKTEIIFANSIWFRGSDISVNAFGFAQRVGESGVLGFNATAMSFGEVDVTTVDAPEGGTGSTYRPQLMNLGLSYAKSFSNSIHVGFLFRVISESISDVTASGFAVDMGIQYVTGPQDNVRFGIALRNVGTPLRFKGDGLSIQLPSSSVDGSYNITVDQRSEKFELPSMLNIGASYDFNITEAHRLTALANFTSNSFIKDYLGIGLEYSLNDMFMLRAAYRYESGITSDLSLEDRSSIYTGLSAGVSVEVPFKEDGPALGIDYSYRTTNPYAGTHTIGVRLNL